MWFLRPTWLHIPGCLALGEWSHHCGCLGIKIFFVWFFCVFLPPLFNIFCFCLVHTIYVLYCAHLCKKFSLGIFNFPEETSSLSHSIVFLYFFALIIEEGFCISRCCSLILCIQIGISLLFSFAFSLEASDQRKKIVLCGLRISNNGIIAERSIHLCHI